MVYADVGIGVWLLGFVLLFIAFGVIVSGVSGVIYGGAWFGQFLFSKLASRANLSCKMYGALSAFLLLVIVPASVFGGAILLAERFGSVLMVTLIMVLTSVFLPVLPLFKVVPFTAFIFLMAIWGIGIYILVSFLFYKLCNSRRARRPRFV
jgi:hypothetical protein